MAVIRGFRDLIVYQKAYGLGMEIFEATKGFPKDEKYSLTDQMRRSSRAVTACIAEAWAKKLYMKHFMSKLTDALGEAYETEVWLDYARDCRYMDHDLHVQLLAECSEIRKILIHMVNNPEKFCRPD